MKEGRCRVGQTDAREARQSEQAGQTTTVRPFVSMVRVLGLCRISWSADGTTDWASEAARLVFACTLRQDDGLADERFAIFLPLFSRLHSSAGIVCGRAEINFHGSLGSRLVRNSTVQRQLDGCAPPRQRVGNPASCLRPKPWCLCLFARTRTERTLEQTTRVRWSCQKWRTIASRSAACCVTTREEILRST